MESEIITKNLIDLNTSYNTIESLLAYLNTTAPKPDELDEMNTVFETLVHDELELNLEDLDDSEIDILQHKKTLDAWTIQIIDGEYYLCSPLLKTIRLAINLRQHRANYAAQSSHLASYLVSAVFKHPNAVCFMGVSDLLLIFPVWNFIAEAGVTLAFKAGVITDTWVKNFKSKATLSCMGSKYAIGRTTPGGLFKCAERISEKKAREYVEIEQILEAHQITEADITGDCTFSEGRKVVGLNSWIVHGRCICCDKSLTYPNHKYSPWKWFHHARHTIKHREMAAYWIMRHIISNVETDVVPGHLEEKYNKKHNNGGN